MNLQFVEVHHEAGVKAETLATHLTCLSTPPLEQWRTFHPHLVVKSSYHKNSKAWMPSTRPPVFSELQPLAATEPPKKDDALTDLSELMEFAPPKHALNPPLKKKPSDLWSLNRAHSQGEKTEPTEGIVRQDGDTGNFRWKVADLYERLSGDCRGKWAITFLAPQDRVSLWPAIKRKVDSGTFPSVNAHLRPTTVDVFCDVRALKEVARAIREICGQLTPRVRLASMHFETVDQGTVCEYFWM